MIFRPNKYQKAIFDWIRSGEGDALVEAVAGSGKTTTLVESSKLIQQQTILFCAFNKHIEKEIAKKISHADVKTVHSIGWRCITKKLGHYTLRVEKHKYSNFIKRDFFEIIEVDLQECLNKLSPEEQKQKKYKMLKELEDLVGYIQMTLTNPKDLKSLWELIEHFRLETEYINFFLPYIPEILARGEEIAITEKVIDYNDMVWLPYRWNLIPFQYDWVFVDEAQDLNRASLDLILKSRKKNGRIIFVGDRRQAIYGFAGADSKSFENIRNLSAVTEFSLSVCYRCPKSHIKKAQTIVPTIESLVFAKNGSIKSISEEELIDNIKVKDMVLCRLSAPLIKTTIDLISAKIPAAIKGKDISVSLIDILSEIEVINGFLYSDFEHFLDMYLNEKIEKLKKQKNAAIFIEKIRDYCRGLEVCHKSFNKINSTKNLRKEIVNLFDDNQDQVVLSTIHKAKGLENDRIFLLLSDMMPFAWENMRDWEKEQEENLTYIAYTRSKQDLFLVKAPKSFSDML